MKEIWFKAKKISDGEWVEGFYVMHSTSISHPYSHTNGEHYILTVPHNAKYKIDPETLSQYTGLTDKNGKKIFEGDIVKFHDSITINGSNIHHSAVEWVAEFSGFMIHADCIGYYNVNPTQVKQYEMEVAGNIFDNPDLLTTSSTDSD